MKKRDKGREASGDGVTGCSVKTFNFVTLVTLKSGNDPGKAKVRRDRRKAL